jgi:hypothetical protein
VKDIPLNLQTLYADLLQNAMVNGRPATISPRRIGGVQHIYALEKDGATRRQRYIGPESDPKTKAERLRHAASRARTSRSAVAALKAARIPAPPLYVGRLLEVLSNAGLFERGVVLIGTAAYQLYPCVVGKILAAGALQTNDADSLIAGLVAPKIESSEPLEQILKRADPTFAANMTQNDKWPKNFVASNTFQVDVLTARGRTDKPVVIPSLQCSATPLRFMEFLTAGSIEAVALYGSGVLVRVPEPARYAVHKLLVMAERPAHSRKAPKDEQQARELFEALDGTPDIIVDAIDDARRRGPKWRKLVDGGLKKIGRGLDGRRLSGSAA